jgi:DNA replication protein DnaC
MVRETIFHHLRDLKLTGMLAVYDEVLEEGRRSRSTTDKTLLRLLTAEVAERHARNHNYRLGQARFPSIKELDSFAFSGTPINEGQVRHLHEGGFLEGHGNVLLVGGSGTGKTHLALSLGMALIRL